MLAALTGPVLTEGVTFGGYLFWSAAYVLVIKRSFQDKSFGIPMLALCVNVPWEFIYTFPLALSTQMRIGNLIWLLMDVAILFAWLRFGRNDYANPISRRWFYPLVAVCLVMGSAVEWSFIQGFSDRSGSMSGTLNTFFTMALMVAMVVRRQSVQGQSLYIALAMLAGNLCGWSMTCISAPDVHPPSAMAFLQVCWWCIIFISVLYAVLVYYQSKADGFKPFRRV